MYTFNCTHYYPQNKQKTHIHTTITYCFVNKKNKTGDINKKNRKIVFYQLSEFDVELSDTDCSN
jgi:hypothetical protein